MSKMAAIYARVSTDEQATNYSLPTQLEACRQIAQAKGYSVLEEFQEDYTGTKLQRPKFDKLQSLVEAGKVDVVLVHDIDRLARNLAHQIIIEEHFDKLGVTIEFALADYADTPEGKLQKHIKGVIAEYEREKILERTTRGRIGKIKAGNISTGRFAKYGYTYIAEGNTSRYEIDPVEAEVVKLINYWFVVERLNRPEIARRLKALEVPTAHDIENRECKDKKRKEKYCWNTAVLWRILTDEAYIGTWLYGKHKWVNGKRILTNRSEWLSVPIPPIISPEMFAAAQERIAENRKYAPRRTKRDYLVRGLMKCSCCGSTFFGRTRTYPVSKRQKNSYTYRYYGCLGAERSNGKDFVNKPCKGYLHVDDVDEVVWNSVKAVLKEPRSILAGLKERQEETRERQQRLVEQQAILSKRIAENTQEVERYLKLYGKGRISEEMLDKMVSELQYENASCEKEITQLDTELESLRISETDVAAIAEYCDAIRQGIDEFSFTEKRAVLEALDVSVIATRIEGAHCAAELKITGCFSDIGVVPVGRSLTQDSVLSVANDTPIAIGRS